MLTTNWTARQTAGEAGPQSVCKCWEMSEINLIVQIGALKEIKRELKLRRNTLLKAVTAEVERLIYEDTETHVDLAALDSSIRTCLLLC